MIDGNEKSGYDYDKLAKSLKISKRDAHKIFKKDAGRNSNMRLYSLGYNEKLMKKKTRLL